MSIPKDVRDAVVIAYYGRVMTGSAGARARAQAAYGIASAIAVGVIAAGLFGGLSERPGIVQFGALAALMAWLVAAALFLHAVASPFETAVTPQQDVDVFVGRVLDVVRQERATIDNWQRRAQLASAVAAIVTVATFV